MPTFVDGGRPVSVGSPTPVIPDRTRRTVLHRDRGVSDAVVRGPSRLGDPSPRAPRGRWADSDVEPRHAVPALPPPTPRRQVRHRRRRRPARRAELHRSTRPTRRSSSPTPTPIGTAAGTRPALPAPPRRTRRLALAALPRPTPTRRLISSPIPEPRSGRRSVQVDELAAFGARIELSGAPAGHFTALPCRRPSRSARRRPRGPAHCRARLVAINGPEDAGRGQDRRTADALAGAGRRLLGRAHYRIPAVGRSSRRRSATRGCSNSAAAAASPCPPLPAARGPRAADLSRWPAARLCRRGFEYVAGAVAASSLVSRYAGGRSRRFPRISRSVPGRRRVQGARW